jgi:hypothetical protein
VADGSGPPPRAPCGAQLPLVAVRHAKVFLRNIDVR